MPALAKQQGGSNMDIDAFVSGNPANTRISARGLDEVEQEFLAGLSREWDAVDEDAFPVMVYRREGQPVAWVDLELGEGYVAA
jgi:hypothetical protein